MCVHNGTGISMPVIKTPTASQWQQQPFRWPCLTELASFPLRYIHLRVVFFDETSGAVTIDFRLRNQPRVGAIVGFELVRPVSSATQVVAMNAVKRDTPEASIVRRAALADDTVIRRFKGELSEVGIRWSQSK
jgi:hypothetical protein